MEKWNLHMKHSISGSWLEKFWQLQRYGHRKITIIALTANAFLEDMEQCTEAGMNAHQAKPMELEKMIRTIAILIKKREDKRKKNERTT